MINFASLFSQFRSNTASAINDLLDDHTTEIDKLLDQDTFLNQYKSGNTKVMEYMKYNRYQELVDYITVVGPADDKKKGYKFKNSQIFRYPLVASDILSSDNSSTIQLFFPSQDIFVDQIKNITKEVEVEVEVEQSDSQQAPKADQTPQEPTTVIQQKLEDTEDAVVTIQTEEKPEVEKKEGEEEQQKQKGQQSAPASKKKTKLVKKTETVQQINKIKKEPLINHLFKYFEGEVNYTLAGYVSKVLIAFYNKKPLPVIEYLLDERRIQHILNHIESRSVGELVTKLMTHETNQLMDQRKLAYEKILARLSVNSEIYVMSNLSVCVCDIIEKVSANIKSQNPVSEFGKVFFTPVVITKVINNVMVDEENISIYNAPVLLIYLTNVPINIPDDKQMVEQFKKLLSEFLVAGLNKLRVTRETRSNLGIGRIKIIEIISFILKNDVLEFRNTVGQNKQLFPILFNLCQQYEMNNILHNQMIKLIDLALSADSNAPSPFLQSLLNNDILFNFIVKQANQDIQIKSGSSNRKTRKGYIGHVINIFQKLLEKREDHPAIKEICERDQFKRIVEEVVNKETFEQRKTLAGYALKKNAGQSIMFVKQDVIQAHFKFLAACPAPVFQPEKAQIDIQHPDYENTHTLSNQEQIQVVQNIKQVENQAQVIEMISNKNEEFNPKFWVNHLQYDVDALMNDL